MANAAEDGGGDMSAREMALGVAAGHLMDMLNEERRRRQAEPVAMTYTVYMQGWGKFVFATYECARETIENYIKSSEAQSRHLQDPYLTPPDITERLEKLTPDRKWWNSGHAPYDQPSITYEKRELVYQPVTGRCVTD